MNRIDAGGATMAGSGNILTYGVMEFLDPGVVVIKPSRSDQLRWRGCIAAAAGILLAAIIFGLFSGGRHRADLPNYLTPAMARAMVAGSLMLMALFFGAIGTLGLKGKIGKKVVVIDRGAGLMWEQRPGAHSPSSDAISLRDVAQVEIASRDVGFTAPLFELNLVLSRPQGERVRLISRGDGESLRSDAKQLAALLRVPLQDRT